MEYTKDMIFSVSYDEVNNVLTNEKKRTSIFFEGIRKHKIMVASVLSLIVFIAIDVALITNFLKILAML